MVYLYLGACEEDDDCIKINEDHSSFQNQTSMWTSSGCRETNVCADESSQKHFR